MFVFATAALFPALLPVLALAAPVEGETPVVQDVTSEISEGRVAAEIVTTLPLFREDVRAKIDGKTLVVYLTGAVIDGGKRSFGEGEGAIRALPRATYTKLEVPLPAGTSCAGPATIDVDDLIARVSMACGAAPAGAALAPEASRQRRVEMRKAESLAARLEAVAKPAAKPLPVIEATAPAPTAPVAAPVAAPVVEAKPIAKEAPKPTRTTEVVGPLPAERTSPFVIVGGLLVMAIAGYLLWRKRRDQKFGMIRILETASLGPKRSLVVAEIDGEKMILGTSEAGISVLTPMSRQANPWNEHTVGGTRIPMPPGMGESTLTDHHMGPKGYAMVAAGAMGGGAAMPAMASAGAGGATMTMDENEGGLLARLFRRREVEIEVTDAEEEPLGNMEDEFRDLLADSIEDEDLRRRLQAGMGGRTS